MAVSIVMTFTAGRFHATPWGRHPNEGVVEWPPSPWRLLRSLAATWKRKLHTDALVNAHAPALLGKLISPPLFKLPSAAVGQTRHYLPWTKKGPADRTLVFDNFVALDSRARIGLHWPDVELSDSEREVLARLLENLSYFGRAESWCEARLAHDWDSMNGALCSWLDSHTGEVGPALQRDAREPVRVLCPNPQTWDSWGYGLKAGRPDPAWNLLAETLDLHAERWSEPPGSRWVTYFRPLESFALRPRRHQLDGDRSWMAQWGQAPTLARFAMSGVVLPRLTETVYVAEIARRFAQGIYGRQNDRAVSPALSGKTVDGAPRDNNHAHAFFLPTDDDCDGRLDHLTIFAPRGLSVMDMKALSAFQRMHGPGNTELQTLLLGFGGTDHFGGVVLVDRSRTWRSATPFITTRHYKERGTKRDVFPRERLAEMNLREELARRGLPEPVWIRPTPACRLAGGRTLAWRDFRQQRVFGDGRRGSDFGRGFELEFAEPVVGPLALGYGCHFGLGLFVPALDR